MLRKGFVDLQVNGYHGVDFASPTLELEQIYEVTERLFKTGTLAYCPTVVTSDFELYRRNLPILARAIDDPAIASRLLGIHVEGPYISPIEGARGAHNAKWMRRPDPDEYDRLQEWAGGHIKILTLAPEVEGARRLIEHASNRHKTVVALGHHMGSREAIDCAVKAGASVCTHLGNGCPNLLHRHNSVVIHQLAHDGLTAGLITDGNHLPPDFISVALRCKGIERVFVVSDTTSIGGFVPGIYEVLGNPVRLTETGRIEHLHEPHLVGSGCNMTECMRYLRSLGFLNDDQLWQVGFLNPLRVVGRSPEEVANPDLPDFVF